MDGIDETSSASPLDNYVLEFQLFSSYTGPGLRAKRDNFVLIQKPDFKLETEIGSGFVTPWLEYTVIVRSETR